MQTSFRVDHAQNAANGTGAKPVAFTLSYASTQTETGEFDDGKNEEQRAVGDKHREDGGQPTLL